MEDVSNRNDCIIKKNLRSELKGVQEKKSIMGVRGRQNKSCQKTTQLAGQGWSDKNTIFKY